MKDHEFRELVNTLRDVALQYHNHESLRERIRNALSDALKKQVPSRPELITPDQVPEEIQDYCIEAAEGYADGWNGCIKTMLAAAPQPRSAGDERGAS